MRGKLDGGLSWLVVLSSFIQQFVMMGTHNVFGLFYIELLDEFNKGKAATAWVGSLSFGFSFALGPVSTTICHRFGNRAATLIGAILFCLGLLLTSFVNDLNRMYLTYSLLFGFGSSLCYYTSILILNEYFHKRLVTTNGMALSGSGVGTLVLSAVVEHFLQTCGWRITMRIICGFSLILFVCVAIQYGVPVPERPANHQLKDQTTKKKFFNKSLFKNKAFVMWIVIISLVLFGFYIPYVHLVRHCQDLNIPKSKGAMLVGYLAISQTIGKIVFGRIADHPRVNRIYLYQYCLLVCSVSTTLLPIMTSIETVAVYCWIFGFHDGCFIVLIAVLTGDIVGKENMASGFGMMYFFSCIPMMFGPPVAGLVYASTGTYVPSFFMAGGFTTIGVCLLFLIPLLLPQEILDQWSMRSKRKVVTLPSNGSLRNEDEILLSKDIKAISTSVSVSSLDAAPKTTLFKEERKQKSLSFILEQYFSMPFLVNQRDSLLSRIYSSGNLFERFVPYTTHVRETDV